MIKLILFDLDGVLVETKNLHFESLNNSLSDEYKISWKEHLAIYDGLKTTQKLDLLSEKKKLPKSEHQKIWNKKQRLTAEGLSSLGQNIELVNLFKKLKDENYLIGVCSNSTVESLKTVITKIGIIDFLDVYYGNQDVNNSKPHPEVYWKAMTKFGVLPQETLIVEDSPYGLLAAARSGAKILRVSSPKEINYELIYDFISNEFDKEVSPKWKDKKLNVVIPMAGAGSRFTKAGFTFPKPLIEVGGKPMIQIVVENLNIDANYIFIVSEEHRQKYNLDTTLKLISPGCKIVSVTSLTEGAACTALLAEKYIDNSNPLFFANSDQYVEWDSNEFFYKMNETDSDGGIAVFKSTHPKWSFVKTNDFGNIVEVQEKNPISNLATVGFYYFKRGDEFVSNAKEMIENKDTVNGEYYLCPVYNYMIKKNKIIKPIEVNEMWGLGTPEDLDTYLKYKFRK